jgi:hypothetical protein
MYLRRESEMRKIVLFSVFIGLMLFVINISGSFLVKSDKDGLQDISLSNQLGILSVLSAGNVYADSERAQGEALGQDKEKKGKALGRDKEKKPKKDKGKGPSLPALPMASAIVLGLGAIGWGRYLFNKNKG